MMSVRLLQGTFLYLDLLKLLFDLSGCPKHCLDSLSPELIGANYLFGLSTTKNQYYSFSF